MPFSDRMMRVLYENLPAFADKLCVQEVYAAFDSIISNVKKLIKPDNMARLEEFETKVKEVSSNYCKFLPCKMFFVSVNICCSKLME